MVDILMRNIRKLKAEEEWKNVWVNKCLNKEDREKLKVMRAEAKERNDQRSEEDKNRFFFKVVGWQIKKWHMETGAANE